MKKYLSVLLSYFFTIAVAAQIGTPITVTEGASYNAFPGLIELSNGNLITFYARSKSHAGIESVQVKKTSSDGGLTWGTEEVVRQNETMGVGGAQPTILSNGRIVLSYSSVDGVTFFFSDDDGKTWTDSTKLITGLSDFTAASARILEIDSGKLLVGFYGKNQGDNYISCYSMLSSDYGMTWSNRIKIADGVTDSLTYLEPNLVKINDSTLLSLIRGDDKFIYRIVSNDRGLTWSKPEKKFSGTGSPRTIVHSDGSIRVFYRARNLDYRGKIAMRVSFDQGVNWTPDSLEFVVDPITGTSNGMMYASPIEMTSGDIGLSYGIETTDSTSLIRFLTFSSKSTLVDKAPSMDIQVFPNPVRNQLFLFTNESNATSLELQIIDMSGNRVFGKNIILENGQYKLDLLNAGLKTGLYIITFSNESIRVQKRIYIDN